MENKMTAPPVVRDLLRAGTILLGSCVIGLAVNAGRPAPLAIFDPHGPGALPDEPHISLDAFKELVHLQKYYILLDVRPDDTFAHGHAPAAVHVPETSFLESYQQQNLASLLKTAGVVVVLCDSSECPSADRAAKDLRELGHTNVRVLEDGWRGYLRTGLPIESGP